MSNSYPPVAVPEPTYSTTGTLSGDGETVELQAPGGASGLVAIRGTFNGRITVTGSVTVAGDTEGGRLLFQSGVGNTGRNYIEGDFTDYNKEFRIVAGGEKVIVRASNWVSGSATVEAVTHVAPSTVFVNGPVHTAREDAIRDARAFTASTGPQAVSAGNIMILTFTNPSDSGVNVHLTNRLFGNDKAATENALEYIAYSGPTYVPTNTQNGINLRGATPFSSAQFRWEVRSQVGLVIGGIEGTGEILPRGGTYSRPLEAMILPGRSVGYVIQGDGNNILQAVRLSMTLEWYEEII